MNELIILKYIILNKDIYIRYYKFLNKEYLKTVYKELIRVLDIIEDWYEHHDVAFASLQDFIALFWVRYPALKKADRDYYHTCFDKMDEIDLSEGTIEDILEAHRKRSVASEVADLAWGIANGQREFQELQGALQTLSEEKWKVEEPEIEFVTDSLEELYQTTYALPGFKWRLKTLRKMMGSLRKGDFGFIFARPEAGKTTFLADQVGSMATVDVGSGARILHCNNEEFGNKVKLRYMQAVLGMGVRDLFADRGSNETKFRDRTSGNIKILDRAVLWKHEVEDVIARVNPDIIVIDSIDKIAGFEDDRDDLVYKQIYQWARELAKVYGPVIGVCHAAQSGEGREYMEMDDVAYAKTAKQGEADWILGIGKSHNPVNEKRRFLHLCKNKLLGDEDSDEELRHGRLPVRLYADIAQYDDELDFE